MTEPTPEQRIKIEAWAEKCASKKQTWIRYLTKLYGPRFIREYGTPKRIMCYTPQQLYGQILHFNRGLLNTAFISVNGYAKTVIATDRERQKVKPDNNSVIITRLFNDFDIEPEKGVYTDLVHKESLEFYDRFEDYPREILYSGSRGFHVEVLKNMTITELNEFNRDIETLKMTTLCTKTDIGRLYRIPYSLHQKTFRQCIPIDPSWSLDKIINESETFRAPPAVIL
jgi:hypothetical protein